MFRRTLLLTAGAALLSTALTGGAFAQSPKVTIAVPGIPPVYSTVVVYVAEKQGFFKKYGATAEIRPFDNGTAAARAVVAGDVDMAWSPTPPVINQVSNADVPLVAVYGMPNPDWVIGTTETGKKCEDLSGQDVGVDSVGGARSVALRSMLTSCKGVTIDDTKQIALGSGPGPAMIAGRLKYAVLHLDDLAAIEQQGKKLNVMLAMKNTDPNSHYLSLVVRKDTLAAKRDAMVKVVAAMIDAARFMQDPKNADVVAETATVTGHSKEIAKLALKEFVANDIWAIKDDGLPKGKIDAVSQLMKKIGAIKADKEAVTYEKFVDATIWKDANGLVK